MKKRLQGIVQFLLLFMLPFATYASVSISETHTNVNCNGASTGTIDITPSGGVLVYTYIWSDGDTTQDRTGLPAGNYSVTVTDLLGASNSMLISITESSAIITTKSITNVYCGGASTGAIDLTVSGGNPGYTYAWNDFVYTEDRTNVTAANYFVTITDSKGCIKTDSANIIQPPGMVINKTITNVTCGSGANGAIDLTVQYGIPGYVFLWGDGAITEDRTAIAAGTYTVTVTDNSGCSTSASATVGQTGGGMAVNTTSANPSCFGGNNGTITVTSVIGSVGPYSFHWSDGPVSQNRTGLSAGSYTVTATSTTGCTAAATVNVSQPAVLNVTLTPIQLTCYASNNGAINTAVTGGTSPYSYNWGGAVFTQNRTGLASGNYTVTVTDFKGCTATATAFVPQPLQLVVTATPAPQTCLGGPTGSVTTTVTGGVGSYSYWWGGGVTTANRTNVNPGNYCVTVTDGNGCTASGCGTIPSYTTMTISGTQVNDVCYGATTGSIDLSVSNGWSPYTYAWSNSAITQDINSLAAGSYTVTVSDNHSCTATRTVTITQPAFPITINAAVADVTCNGGSTGTITVSVSNGVSPYTYHWADAVFTQNRTGLSSGTYTLTVTDNNSCTASNSATVNQPTPVVITSTVTDINCFGGNTGAINLNISGGFAPYTYVWSNGAVTQNISGLSQGAYQVTVMDNHSCSASSSVTVNQNSLITIAATVTNLTCNGDNTGAINISAAGGTVPYTYSWGTVTTQNRTALSAGNYTVTVFDNFACSATSTSTVSQPAALALSSVNTNVSCNGGTNGAINLNVTGGTSPYTFNWGAVATQNRTSLIAGTYNVTVTDNGSCTATYSTTVTQPSALGASAMVNNVTCNGGTDGVIGIATNGGTSPYSYNWGNGIVGQIRNGLTAGTYPVTVTDANSCSTTASGTITEPAAITASSVVVNATCFGSAYGSIDLSVAGGTGAYTYVWSNGSITQDISSLAANTYTVTVKDASNCTVSASNTVTEPTQLALTNTHTNISCNGQANGSIDLTVTGGTPNYTYNWSNGAVTQDVSGLSAQNYTVTVNDNNACSAVSAITITAPAVLSISETHTNVSCNGGSNATVNTTPVGGVTPYSFNWGVVTTQNRTGLSAGTYPVTVTDANSCTAAVTAVIAEPAALVLSTSVSNVNCNGASTGAIDLTVTGGVASYLYHWNNNILIQDLAGVNAGTYTVTVTDANACTAVTSATIAQPNPVSVNYTSTNVTCYGANNGAISTVASGGNGGYQYNWSNGSAAPSLNNIGAGNYTLQVSDAYNCTAGLAVTVTQPAQIVLSETHTNVSCNGAHNGAVDLSVSGGSLPYTYNWSNGAATQDVTALSANSYRVTVTDNTGCTAVSSPVNITQPVAISLSTVATDVSCNGAATGKIDLTVTGGTGAYLYHWSNNAATQNISGVAAGSYAVTVTDANACTANTNAAVTQLNPISTNITATDVTCHGGSNGALTLFVQGGTAPYILNWNNGAHTSTISNLPAANYRVLVIDANNCNAIDSASISEPGLLQLAKTVTDVTCHGLANGAISIAVTGGAANYTYTWNIPGGTPNIANLTSGNYAVTVTDANACSAASGNIVVAEPQQLNIAANITTVGCAANNDGAIQLQVTGGTAPFTYGWGNTSTAPAISNLAAGNYTVTVTDNKGCTANGSYAVGSAPSLVLNTHTQNTACADAQTGAIDLTVTGGTSAFNFNWSNGKNTEDITGLPQGAYAVTVTDSRNCSAVGNYTIGFDYALTVDASPSTTINLGESVQLIAVTNVDHGNTYFWSPGSEVVCSSCASTTAAPMVYTLYTVNVVDANGCKASDTLSVAVNSVTDIFIPNAFSPNADGNNDMFELYGDVSNIAFLDFAIFDRWGEKVFETSNHHFAWDGTYKGETVQQGVYIYTAKIVFSNGSARNDLKGSLTVIR